MTFSEIHFLPLFVEKVKLNESKGPVKFHTFSFFFRVRMFLRYRLLHTKDIWQIYDFDSI